MIRIVASPCEKPIPVASSCVAPCRAMGAPKIVDFERPRHLHSYPQGTSRKRSASVYLRAAESTMSSTSGTVSAKDSSTKGRIGSADAIGWLLRAQLDSAEVAAPKSKVKRTKKTEVKCANVEEDAKKKDEAVEKTEEDEKQPAKAEKPADAEGDEEEDDQDDYDDDDEDDEEDDDDGDRSAKSAKRRKLKHVRTIHRGNVGSSSSHEGSAYRAREPTKMTTMMMMTTTTMMTSRPSMKMSSPAFARMRKWSPSCQAQGALDRQRRLLPQQSTCGRVASFYRRLAISRFLLAMARHPRAETSRVTASAPKGLFTAEDDDDDVEF
eukprot:scaffold1881_cov256-Pinguiococcus_pyrenoidosus.AAC.21